MFAVPGWSVSSDALKPEVVNAASNTGSNPKSKKRKRPAAGSANDDDVTASNVDELYQTVIEGKRQPLPDQKSLVRKEKKRRMKEGPSQSDQPQADGAVEPKKAKKTKQRKKNKKQSLDGQGKVENGQEPQEQQAENTPQGQKTKKAKSESRSQDTPAQPPQGKAPKAETTAPVAQREAPKLTPLQASMREKLVSARFRHLNETLYTKPSEEAFRLFQDTPEMFDEYHEGFRRQVKVWPENPVDSFLRDIRTRGKARQPGKGKPAPQTLAQTALPRTNGTCTIADLGCGDAGLAQSLQKDKNKIHVDVKSFDLQSPSPLVTKADIANLPLPDGSVNVAVFCLALMGTNWIDFVEEAYRILHWKGELWIAEIKCRFTLPDNKRGPVRHSVGARQKGKGRDAQGDEGAEQDLAVEVDGAEDKRRETDVSAFIEVLRKRGFVLQGERRDAVDLSNRMFVKMHFTKGAAPTKGKGVQAAKPEASGRGKKGAIRWPSGGDDEQAEVNEAAILKPCVYKIR